MGFGARVWGSGSRDLGFRGVRGSGPRGWFFQATSGLQIPRSRPESWDFGAEVQEVHRSKEGNVGGCTYHGYSGLYNAQTHEL